MTKLETIEGIGAQKADKLRKAGIKTCEQLLADGATKKGRKGIATATGYADTTILEWVNRADLMRVPGVSRQYSDLLEAAGVDTVKELRRRNVKNLVVAMEEANTKGRNKLVQRTPSEKVVQKWVDAAKGMDAVVKY